MPEIDETTPYNSIRKAIATKYPKGSRQFLTIMELVSSGLLESKKAVARTATERRERMKEKRYGGYSVGIDETAGPGSKSAGRPGGS